MILAIGFYRGTPANALANSGNPVLAMRFDYLSQAVKGISLVALTARYGGVVKAVNIASLMFNRRSVG